jgi:hypothetical protein
MGVNSTFNNRDLYSFTPNRNEKALLANIYALVSAALFKSLLKTGNVGKHEQYRLPGTSGVCHGRNEMLINLFQRNAYDASVWIV